MPLKVEVQRLDQGDYFFGRIPVWIDLGDMDGDGTEELYAAVQLTNEGETE